MFGAPDDNEGNFVLLSFAGHAKPLKLVIENFASALPPVSEDSHARLELKIDGIGDAAIGSGTGDTEEIAGFFGLCERSGEAERDVANFSPHQLLGGLGNLPGEFKLLGEHIGGASGKQGKRNAMTVLLPGQTVYNFVDRAVAATGDDQLAAIVARLPRNFGGFTGTGGFCQVGLNAASAEDPP